MQKITIFFSISILLFSSCSKESPKLKSAYSFEKIKIDSKIKQNDIFKWLNSQYDFNMSYETNNRKKTSAAQFYKREKGELNVPEYYFYNNCRAYFFKDTLQIRIGTTTYMSDHGVVMKYKNGKYNCLPFQSYDVVLHDSLQKPKDYLCRNRILILDKVNYKNGDSLFGRIHAEIEEPTNEGSKDKRKVNEYFVDGFFRAKVGEL